MKLGQKQETALSYHEENALKEEEKRLQDMKDGVELRQGVKFEPEDLNALDRRLKQIKDLRSRRGVDSEVSGAERDYLEKREKMLREHLQSVNPSFNDHQYLRPKDGPRYSKLVQQELQNMMDPEYQAMVKDWKDCRRRLFPNDPTAADTRYLYPESN